MIVTITPFCQRRQNGYVGKNALLLFTSVINSLFLGNTAGEFRHKGFSTLPNIFQNFLVRHLGMFQGIVFAQFANVFCIKAVAHFGSIHITHPPIMQWVDKSAGPFGPALW